MPDPVLDAATGAAFLEVARRRGEANALRWAEGSFTYAELAERVYAVGAAFSRELDPGDRLAIWAANQPEWIVAQLGAALAGVVLVPLNPALTDAEAAFIVTDSGARAVLAGSPWRGRDLVSSAERLGAPVWPLETWTSVVGDASPLPSVAPEDLLLIQYTSGTTGTPKGAMLSHLLGTNVGPMSHRALGLTEDDVVCSPLPFHHVGGSVCTVLATLLRGACYVVLPGFDAAETLATLARERVTFFGGVPTMLVAMLELCGGAPPDLPDLRLVMVGGSTVSPALITRMEDAFGIEVTNGYGQSEAPSALQTRPGDSPEVKALTIGRANPDREVAVLDPITRAPVPDGVVGELCLRGPLLMTGYWAERDAPLSSAFDADGRLHTGDLASMDGDGVVTLHARLRDVIIRGGENIYPAEVEAVLITHPAVLDVAVVGAPDPYWGEVPAAFVRAAASFDPVELEAFARERLAGFKVPRQWHEVAEFPLTASGKVQKFRLAERLEAS